MLRQFSLYFFVGISVFLKISPTYQPNNAEQVSLFHNLERPWQPFFRRKPTQTFRQGKRENQTL